MEVIKQIVIVLLILAGIYVFTTDFIILSISFFLLISGLVLLLIYFLKNYELKEGL